MLIVADGGVRRVGDVDEHPAAVHLGNQRLAEGAQTAPGSDAGAAVPYLIVRAVGEGDVAHAAPVKRLQQAEIFLDRGGVLDGQDDGVQAGFPVAPDSAGASCKRNGISILRDLPEAFVQQAVGVVRGRLALQAGGHVGGEKRGVHLPPAHLGKVHLGEGVVHPEIAEPDHLRRRVAVRIQYYHGVRYQSIRVPHSSVLASRSRLHSR